MLACLQQQLVPAESAVVCIRVHVAVVLPWRIESHGGVVAMASHMVVCLRCSEMLLDSEDCSALETNYLPTNQITTTVFGSIPL